jgi:hypothetical protein
MVIGCGGADPDGKETIGNKDDHSAVGTAREALTTNDFSWTQGQGPTIMMNDQQGFCFLTAVGGHFEGFGEGVWIDNSNGSWFLFGKSQQAGVRASAKCVPWPQLNNDGAASWTWNNWTPGSSPGHIGGPVQLWDRNSFCFLGGVQGIFRGVDEWAQTQFMGNGGWITQAASNVGTNGNASDGMCVWLGQSHAMFFTNEATWHSGMGAVDLGPTSDRVCALTLVRGSFVARNPAVSITALGSEWVLQGTGTASVGYVEARARCVFVNQ